MIASKMFINLNIGTLYILYVVMDGHHFDESCISHAATHVMKADLPFAVNKIALWFTCPCHHGHVLPDFHSGTLDQFHSVCSFSRSSNN